MNGDDTPSAEDFEAMLRKIGRMPKTSEELAAARDREAQIKAVRDLPTKDWPEFDPVWDLAPESQKYVLDAGKDEFDTFYPDGLALRWVSLAELDEVLAPGNRRTAEEVWSVGDPGKAAGVLADWIAGRALTPPGVGCFEKRMLPLIGGNHRLAVARARGVVRLPILIDPVVLAEVAALIVLEPDAGSERGRATSGCALQ